MTTADEAETATATALICLPSLPLVMAAAADDAPTGESPPGTAAPLATAATGSEVELGMGPFPGAGLGLGPLSAK